MRAFTSRADRSDLPDTKAEPWPAPATGRWLLAVLVIFICSSAFAADIPSLVRKAKPAVVQLLVYDQDEELVATATGFFITPDGKLLTNYHVVAAGQTILAKSDTRRYRLKSILVSDEERDVAELQFNADHVPYLTLGSSSSAQQGEAVIVIGNPEEYEGTVSNGIISAFRHHRSMIQITAPISPGSSGSPVIDVESGEVIGIAERIDEEGQNLNFAVSADAVRYAIANSKPPKPELSEEQINRAIDQMNREIFGNNPIKAGPKPETATTHEESFWIKYFGALFWLVALAMGLICWAYARLRSL